MAIYEYTCPEHGKYERLIKMSDSDNPQACPVCANLYPKDEISSGGSFQLKGDWFKNKGKY